MADTDIIRARLRELGRQERRLLLGRACLQALAAFLGLGLLTVVLVWLRVSHTTGLVVAGAGLLGVAAAFLFPIALRWWRAVDVGRQAIHVEALRPALRGRLITATERLDGQVAGESEALLHLLFRRVATAMAEVAPSEVHPWSALRRFSILLATTAFLFLLCAVVAPVSPWQATQILLHGGTAVAHADLPTSRDEPATVVVGDIVLVYRYPAYTGLQPLEVPNSTGTVHAPLGTQVEIRARTADVFSGVALVVNSTTIQAPSPDGAVAEPQVAQDHELPASIENGRDLSTSFEVTGPGTWAFRLDRGVAVERSPAFPVEVEADLAPEVLADAPEGRLDVAWDQPLPITWTARDDYGIVRVEAVATRDGGGNGGAVLRTPLDPVVRLEGTVDATPASLGLEPGDEGTLKIVAWDNDSILGSKAGESRVIRVSVLGPRGEAARRTRMVKELRDILVVVLADFLEEGEGFPPNLRGEMAIWGETLVNRREPMDTLLERYWDGFAPDTFEGTVVVTIRRSYDSLLAFVQALSDPGSQESVTGGDHATLRDLRSGAVTQVERGILTLDAVVRMQAMARLSELARDVAREAQDLASLHDADANEILSRLDRLERQIQRLAQAAREMSEGSLPEFVNSRVADARSLIDEIRKAVAEGRLDDARAMIERLSQDLAQFSKTMGDMEQSRSKDAERTVQEANQLIADLDQLEKEQRALAEQTAQARSQDGQHDLVDHWTELEQRARALAEVYDAMAARMATDERRLESERYLATGSAREARDVADAIAARDLPRAIDRARDMEWMANRFRETVVELEEQLEAFNSSRADRAEVIRILRLAEKEAVAIRKALEALEQTLAQDSPELRQQTQGMVPQQEQVAQRTELASRKADKLAQEFPMQAPGLSEGVKKAHDEMGRASQELQGGQAMEAEGAQRSAADNLASARDALKQAMKDAEEMAQFGQQQGQASNGGEARKDGSGSRPYPDRTQLPVPEEFRTPEEYRRALLQGMEAEVPEEYEALKRRYYEELVHQ